MKKHKSKITSVLPAKRNKDKNDLGQIELKFHEQEERVNVLLIITGCILLLNALGLSGKLVFDGVLSSKFKMVKPIDLYSVLEVVMPVPHVAIFGDVGYVKDFTLFGTRLNNEFPKLPHAQVGSEEGEHLSELFPLYELFAVHHIDHVYFLSCNPNRLVTKVNVDARIESTDQDNGQFNYETILGSYIPNDHVVNKICGVQVGNYFWILGGSRKGTSGVQIKTSIWVLNREHWIVGPELPEFNSSLPNFPIEFKPVPLNSSSVLFVSYSHFIKYNFLTDTWTIRNNPFGIDAHFACQKIQDKNYTTYLVCIHGLFIKSTEVWNLDTNQFVSKTIASTFPPTNEFMESMNYLHQATLITLFGELYLVDEYNAGMDNMSSIYKVLPAEQDDLYAEPLRLIEGPLFLEEFQDPQKHKLIETYYDTPKSVSFLHRTYKTVKRIV